MCADEAMDLSTLGRRLGYLRRRAGLGMGKDVTRKDIAKALGVSQQVVGEWEADEKGPARARVPRVAALYGVEIDWLLTGKGPAPATVQLSLKPETPQRKLVDALKRRRKKEG